MKSSTTKDFLLWGGLATFVVLSMGQLSTAQASSTKPISSADAASHIGEKATVCGTVVDSKISKYALPDHGKPVNLDLDRPEPTPSFFLVTFGSKGQKPEEVVSSYQGKQLCVSGKITQLQGVPFIMAADPTQIQVVSKK